MALILDSVQSNVSAEDEGKDKFRLTKILGIAGAGAGIVYAFKTHKRTWGYIASAFFGGLIGGTAGKVIELIGK